MDGLDAVDRVNLWGQPVYAKFEEEVDPFRDLDRFRPLTKAYTGDTTFWQTPSPEPHLSDEFWQMVALHLPDPTVQAAAAALAAAIAEWQPHAEKLIFVAILRAGVPIADWLTRLLPGSVAISTSLFAGLGIDQVALDTVQREYPDRHIVFVDGWTGRGGVARELAKLNKGPLAVLNDPWGWADFCGVQADIFCPTACFTGVATLGFSRTFFTQPDELFSAYLFPLEYTYPHVVQMWQQACPPSPTHPPPLEKRFFTETDLRLHSNEVCRALINAAPQMLYFAADRGEVEEKFPLLLALAERRHVPISYQAAWLEKYRTQVACSLKTS